MPTANAPAPPQTDKQILDLARKAARAAGAVQLECREKLPTVDRLYAHDIKLEADRLSEEAIVDAVRAQMPDAAFSWPRRAAGSPAAGSMSGSSIPWTAP
jgi:3'-phosphoadenosine 5'-phosphosulfate (PAPS) 3'-phosphatase